MSAETKEGIRRCVCGKQFLGSPGQRTKFARGRPVCCSKFCRDGLRQRQLTERRRQRREAMVSAAEIECLGRGGCWCMTHVQRIEEAGCFVTTAGFLDPLKADDREE